MSFRSFTVQIIAGLFVLHACAAEVLYAQNARALIERGKSATAFIAKGSGRFGASATCIAPSGVFVTINNMVLHDTIELVLYAGEENERKVRASVVRRDQVHDIAVLQAEAGEDFPFLELGDDSKLQETDRLTLFGYPFGDQVDGEPEDKTAGESPAPKKPVVLAGQAPKPQMSVSICRISSLRKKGDALDEIQIDAEISPGQLGAPAIDAQGKLIGLARTGIFAAGVNFLAPISHILAILKAPMVSFENPRIAKSGIVEEQVATLRLNSLVGPLPSASLELELTHVDGSSRQFAAKETGPGVYQFRFKPMEALDTKSPPWIWANVEFPGGELSGHVLNQSISLNGQSIGLEQIRRLELKGLQGKAQLTDGREMSGGLANWPECTIDVGGAQWKFPPEKFTTIELQPALFPVSPPIHYSVGLKQGAESVTLLTGELAIEGAPSPFDAWRWSPYQGEKKEVKTPASIVDATLGAGGQLLLLQTEDNSVSIFDVNEAALAGTFKLPAADARIAASMDHLFAVVPSTNQLLRWSLKTKSLELSCTVPVPAATFSGMAIGYASRGPLVLTWTDSQSSSGSRHIAFFDPLSLRRLPIDLSSVHSQGAGFLNDKWHLRASANGSYFAFFPHVTNPIYRVAAIQLDGKKAHVYSGETNLRTAIPSYDGRLVFTGDGAMESDLERKVERVGRNLLPTTHPAMSLMADSEIYMASMSTGKLLAQIAASAAIIEPRNPQFSVEIQRLRERPELTPEKRLLLIPQASVVLMIPKSEDRIVVFPFDATLATRRNPTRPLFCDTPSLGLAWRGARYFRPLNFQSFAGKHEFTLTKGPSGMRITPMGELDWRVPRDFPDRFVDIGVTVKNSDGTQLDESMRLPLYGELP